MLFCFLWLNGYHISQIVWESDVCILPLLRRMPIIAKTLCASFCLYSEIFKVLMVMEKIISLCKNFEFQRLYRRGKSIVRPTLVMYCIKGKEGQTRLGITAGKKVGNAVCRNRAKRRLRELFRTVQKDIKPGFDICIVARNRILTASYDMLVRDFTSAATELKLYNKNEETTD